MKIGLIGFGSIGERHYKNLKKHSQKISVFTSRTDVSLLDKSKSWDDFVVRGPFDVIFITNETYKHLPTIKKCIDLNPRAIFVEKPLSHNTNGLQQIAKLLKHRKISLFVGYCLQFYEPFIRIKKIINSKKLGKIYYLNVFAGGDLRMWRKRDYRKSYSSKKRMGGGVMFDLIHDINYPAWMLNDNLIPKNAFLGHISSLKIDVEDFAVSNFVSQKKSIPITVHQDYISVPGGRAIEIAGENGTLYWNSSDNIIRIATNDKSKNYKEKVKIEHNDMYQKELSFFFNQIKKKRFFTNIDEAIKDIINIERLKSIAKHDRK